jgi:ubiquinone/menaquinone biosynthesis C-methylase UbiE
VKTPRPERFSYDGYEIPVDLVTLTGGGPATWDAIARMHMAAYARYAPIEPDFSVLEVGCGVGRDAIPLSHLLSPAGGYIGVDIIKPSIVWCRKNITPKFPNFRFVHFDVQSDIHNPRGAIRSADVRMPVPDVSVDRILLQSVFTHMFEPDIVSYLREFVRVLRPHGIVVASFFIVDDEARSLAVATKQCLTFEHQIAPDCWVNDPEHPEGAVSYSEAALRRMLAASGLRLIQPIHRGAWCGREGRADGQDMCILGRADQSAAPAA